MCACLRHLTSLRQLMGPPELSPDTLAALGPLTALTQLRLVGPTDIVVSASVTSALQPCQLRRPLQETLCYMLLCEDHQACRLSCETMLFNYDVMCTGNEWP
jgi:hypothetical protein